MSIRNQNQNAVKHLFFLWLFIAIVACTLLTKNVHANDDAIDLSLNDENDDVAIDEDVEYKSETTMDFEDLVLEGEVKKPQGSTMTVQSERSFDSMIEERKNFEPEMVRSVDMLE